MRGLALEIGVSPSTLSRWIGGKQTPSPESCQKLAKCLSVPVEEILILAGHLAPAHNMDIDSLPEFREYAHQKYAKELDEDIISMIEDLIQRRRIRSGEVSQNQ